MRVRWPLFLIALLATCVSFGQAPPQTPLQPFSPDEHTLLLYHFDEGEGTVARDSGPHGYDGEVQGARWTNGRFDKALRFDGKDDCVYRAFTERIAGLKEITVECWFRQDNQAGRQFLAGKDVTFHYDVTDGGGTSLSLYNEGGAVNNAEGKPHQHLGIGLSISSRGWHHGAVTYDGQQISFFLDGVLQGRLDASRDFLLGLPDKGLWIGCYVGKDYWFSGWIDELRISDCVRYDPDKQLAVGGKVFDMPGKAPLVKTVRQPKQTGLARLDLTLTKLYGQEAAGRIYLKPPGRPAVIVGEYALRALEKGGQARVSVDVSDEVTGDGNYLVGLEATEAGAYFALTQATLTRGGQVIGRWTGQARSRRTFDPPVLVPLRVGSARPAKPEPLLLLPRDADRIGGDLTIEEDDGVPLLTGNGYAEYWVDLPVKTTYRVSMRYISSAYRPCDLVIDGRDLNDYNMCALTPTPSSSLQDAFWEYQGTTTLAPGAHWIRVQDVIPDIIAIRFDPVDRAPRRSVPWQRFPVPAAGFLSATAQWNAPPPTAVPAGAAARLHQDAKQQALRFDVTFPPAANPALGGTTLRFTRAVRVNLEPFGRLKLRFEGQGTQHVVALRAVDAKGDEKLLWRYRDTEAGPQEIAVPLSFEGNDVFDPARVVALHLDCDQGNVRLGQESRFRGALIAPTFERRDRLATPAGYPQALTRARKALAAAVKRVTAKAEPLLSPGFQPWTKPVVPEEHPLFATTEPKPVTRRTLGYDLHTTGARSIDPNTLADYHEHYDFGDICWPHLGICPQRRNFTSDADYQEALAEFERRCLNVRERGLYCFDIWGYVPHDPSFPDRVAPEHHEILMRVFGDRFLGYDNGEQDGRYIGAYADRGPHTNRKEGWEDFVRWDTTICNDHLNYMNATGSLNYSHYYGERGARMLGLET
ncbi:MAG: LamG domain-containing protein, partial [Armatimonadetes bacterium]|nr:LamG domain-containing protein [Armatimonadota bacterium]